jgi:hypothetical protein
MHSVSVGFVACVCVGVRADLRSGHRFPRFE